MKNFQKSGVLSEEFEGVVQGHRDGHGFVLREQPNPDVYLPPNEMRAVLHQDRVRARVVRTDRRGRPEGRVVAIVERTAQTIIGRLLHEAGIWLVAPEDKRYGQDILIPKSAVQGAQAGQVVVAELTEPPALYGQPVGRVREILGDPDDPGMEIEIAVRKFGLPHVFSVACMQQVRALADTLGDDDRQGRVDLTDVPLVTIDGEDARDFDDAVYATPCSVGKGRSARPGWRLLVAIADVSHYVQGGSASDRDAFERATSVYFPRRVIPMLPEKLSNGLCSLNPEVDRLCMVCDMLIDEQGDVPAYQFYPAVMHSHARFTYTEVAAILSNTAGLQAQRRQARVPDLLHLAQAYQALLRARERRGALDFETVETQIVCDASGRVERIEPRKRNEAHRLIEEAMLAANVCAADFITRRGHAGLMRVHEGPTPEKLKVLQDYLTNMGVPTALGESVTPAGLQAVARATRERPDAAQIHTMLLRSMQQAVYTPYNKGHFGLAYAAYTHFTSPIRRYPDLLVHRIIKALLAQRTYTLPDLASLGELTPARPVKGGARSAAAKPATSRSLLPWEAVGVHCSANERRADEASRDVEAWLKCRYMRDHLGEEFEGLVSAVTSFGLFVTLETLYVEGLVHITELGGDYYRFDEARQELLGERTGLRYGLGKRVRVQVSRVDLDGRRIDFRLLPQEGSGGADVSAHAPLDGSDAAPPPPQRSAKPRTASKGKSKPSSPAPRQSGKRRAG